MWTVQNDNKILFMFFCNIKICVKKEISFTSIITHFYILLVTSSFFYICITFINKLIIYQIVEYKCQKRTLKVIF